MSAAWISGALAGAVHAVSGPDHLAALIPLCMGKGIQAFKEGAIWGLGHGLGCSMMGLIGVIFKNFINIHLVSEYMEYVVGFTLILLGFIGIRRSQKWSKSHARPSKADNCCPDTLRLHKTNAGMIGDIENGASVHCECTEDIGIGGKANDSFINLMSDILEQSPLITILVTGIIHGFSGTGHILGVIPALTYKDISNGIKYLSAFCVGTALSMSMFTMFVGMIGVLIANSLKKDVKKSDDQQYNEELPAIISFYASVFSVVVGLVWIVQPLVHTVFNVP